MEIKTKFNLGDDAYRVTYGADDRPTIWNVGTVVGYQITQAGTEVIVRYSGTDKSYPDDVLSTKMEVNERWSNEMRAHIEDLKREISECEKVLEAYEKCKNK